MQLVRIKHVRKAKFGRVVLIISLCLLFVAVQARQVSAKPFTCKQQGASSLYICVPDPEDGDTATITNALPVWTCTGNNVRVIGDTAFEMTVTGGAGCPTAVGGKMTIGHCSKCLSFVVIAPIIDPESVVLEPATNKLIVTNGSTAGPMYQIDASGRVSVFAQSLMVPPGSHLATPGNNTGGFVRGDIFVGNSTASNELWIDEVTSAGVIVAEPFARCSAPGPDWFISGLTFDSVGNFGRDLLVVASTSHMGVPELFRVHNGGTCQLVANLGALSGVIEGLAIAPSGFGVPGQAILGVEDTGQLAAVDSSGIVTILNGVGNLGNIESLNFVPGGIVAYIVNFPGRDLIEASGPPQYQFTSADVGSLIVSDEGGNVPGYANTNFTQVRYNSTGRTYSQLGIDFGEVRAEAAIFVPFSSFPVGGTSLPIDYVGLLAPYALAVIASLGAVFVVVYCMKHSKFLRQCR